MMRAITSATLALVLAGGCSNSCQQVCVRMADYADECGLNVPAAELDTCLDDFAKGVTKEDRKVCRDYGDAETIRKQWTCDDLEVYWGVTGT